MPITRRNLLKFFAAAVVSSSAAMAEPTPMPTPSPDEQKVISYMGDHGITRFTMLSKKRGQILFIEDGQMTAAESALSGKIKGDKMRSNLGTTPTGIHILQSYRNGTHISFKRVEGTNIDYAIHTVINPKGQNRLGRILSTNAEFKRISSGCVNVMQSTVDALLKFMEKDHQIFYDDHKKPYVMGVFFVVLPETHPIQSILKYPEIPIFPEAKYN